MTVRVTTLKGADAGAYYLDALGRYYLDATGEPAGVWHGTTAHGLGLTGAVDDDAFLNVMAGRHPTSGVTLGREYTSRSVRGFDLTASAPKSVSVLWALGDEHTREVVVAAHDRAVDAMLGWVENHALTRYRVNGEINVVDASGLVAAAFRQHTSRALDPQLHTHLVLANRVRGDDGRWLALDARGLKVDQRTLSAIYHAGLRGELTTALGVEWEEPHNGIAEIAGYDRRLLAEFSTRTNQLTDRIDTKLARFTDTMGRAPTPRERWRLEREAVVDSRPAKRSGNDAHDLHRDWIARARTLHITPERLTRVVTGAITPTPLTPQRLADAALQALSAISERQSTWRPAELVRELAAALPTTTGIPAAELHGLLDATIDTLITAKCVDLSPTVEHLVRYRRDGRPVTEAATDRVLTTEAILAEETRLLAWAQARQPANTPVASIPTPEHLTGPQRHAAAAIAGTDQLVLIVGPAGTGKTTAIAPAITALQQHGRTVFGVAPSAVAADVLATETGVDADTLDKLLHEHRSPRPPQHRYDLPPGTTLIVDEAAMVPTANLAELAALADTRKWRVVLVGDAMQFSPVGRGGMYTLLCDTVPVIELDTVRRFINTWERDASLRLRRSDPTVLDLYDTHQRIHTLAPEAGLTPVIDAWHTARGNGSSVLLLAAGNDTVAALNQAAQQRLLATGELRRRGARTIGDVRLHVGEKLVTRRNDRTLTTNRGHAVHNRDEWTITAISRRGDLTVTGPRGRVRLPRTYVDHHVQLAYAQTSHAAQGRTVDHAILYLDTPTDTAGIYVPLTRGRHTNHAYVLTRDNETAHDVLTTALSQQWIDRPAHVRRAERNPERAPAITAHELADRAPLPRDELLELLDHQRTLRLAAHQAQHEERELSARLRQLTDRHERLTHGIERLTHNRSDAQAVIDELDRPLRRRRHRHQLADAATTIAHADERLPQLHEERRAVSDEIAATHTALTDNRARQPERDALDHQLRHVDQALAHDLDNRARHARQHPNRFVIQFGPRPEHERNGQLWDRAVAHHHRYRTAHPDTTTDDLTLALAARRAHQALNHALQPAHHIDHDHGIEL